MTVENSHVVDAVGIDEITGYVVLTIADHLHWEVDGHTAALEEKINSYLSFVESGQLLESYPAAKGKAVRILIVFKYALTRKAFEALSNLASDLAARDVDLTWQHFPGSPAH